MGAQTIDYDKLGRLLDDYPYPLLFVTVGGAHQYGFASADSDLRLWGVHAVPTEVEARGLAASDQQTSIVQDKVKFDTCDIVLFNRTLKGMFAGALEQLYSPLVVRTSAVHQMLKACGKECITRDKARYYQECASTQWKQFREESPPRVESLLGVYRVLLTGIQMMKTGWVEANLQTLSREAKLMHVEELIKRKIDASKDSQVDAIDVAFHESEYNRLVAELKSARDASTLPERTPEVPALEQLVAFSRIYGSV